MKRSSLLISLSLVFFLCFSFTGSNVIAEDGLMAEYHFDYGVGATLDDTSNLVNHGSINGAEWVTGIDGYALNFDGYDDYVEVPHDNLIESFFYGQEFSIFVWIKTSTANSGRVFEKAKDGAGIATGYSMYVNTDGRIVFSMVDSGGASDIVYGPNIIDDEWHHVGVVRRYGSIIELFVDGVRVDTKSNAGGSLYNTNSMYIGTDRNVYWDYKGYIDELKIYDLALNLSEIQANYEYFAGTSYSTLYVPLAPQGLQAIESDRQATLSWNAPSSNGGSNITNYNIYRGQTIGNEALLTTVGNISSYTDSQVTNEQEYYYRVSAVNNAGEGSQSNRASVTPTSNPDSDDDGLLDSWERTHFGDLNQSSSDDFDNDSYSNLQEYNEGTLPNNNLSHPIESEVSDSDSDFDYPRILFIFMTFIILVFVLAARKRSLDARTPPARATAQILKKEVPNNKKTEIIHQPASSNITQTPTPFVSLGTNKRKAVRKIQDELSKMVTLTVPSFMDSNTSSEIIASFNNMTDKEIQNISIDLSNLEEFFTVTGEIAIGSLRAGMEIKKAIRIRAKNEEGTFPIKIIISGNGQSIEKKYAIKVGGTEIY